MAHTMKPRQRVAHYDLSWRPRGPVMRVPVSIVHADDLVEWQERLHKQAQYQAMPLTSATHVTMVSTMQYIRAALESIMVRPHYRLPITVSIIVGNVVPDLSDYDEDPLVKHPFHAVAEVGIGFAARFFADQLGYDVIVECDDMPLMAESQVMIRLDHQAI